MNTAALQGRLEGEGGGGSGAQGRTRGLEGGGQRVTEGELRGKSEFIEFTNRYKGKSYLFTFISIREYFLMYYI